MLVLLLCLTWTAMAQDSDGQEPEWYLDEVVNDMFVDRNDFDYYYLPSAADVAQQRAKGEVSYFLNTPGGLNTSKVRTLIDRIMASYDDVKAVGDWHTTSTTYWKEYRIERNKFRFSIKRKVLDDGTYYVSVTESTNHYKSLAKGKQEKAQADDEPAAADKPVKRRGRDRHPVTLDEEDVTPQAEALDDATPDDAQSPIAMPVVTDKQRRQQQREQEKERQQQERLAKRHAQEEQRAQEKARKEAEKQRRAQEKAQRQEQERLIKEQQRQQQEQERLEREAARKQAAALQSHYHYSDVALWLSERYDFTLTATDGSTSCTMFSTAVKDNEMAKLAIKNALKGSNARMAIPWRLNSDNGMVETGYTVDGHVLVFAIGKNGDGNVTLVITEVSAEQFELFKQSLSGPQ